MYIWSFDPVSGDTRKDYLQREVEILRTKSHWRKAYFYLWDEVRLGYCMFNIPSFPYLFLSQGASLWCLSSHPSPSASSSNTWCSCIWSFSIFAHHIPEISILFLHIVETQDVTDFSLLIDVLFCYFFVNICCCYLWLLAVVWMVITRDSNRCKCLWLWDNDWSP